MLSLLCALTPCALAQGGGALNITANAAADVVVDAQPAVAIPEEIKLAIPLTAGRHHVVVTSKRGGFRWETDVEAVAGGAVELRANVAPRDVWYDVNGRAWALADNGHTVSLVEASDYCVNLRVNGFDHWRLPTFKEILQSYDVSLRRPLPGVNLSTGYIWTLDNGCDNALAPAFGCTPRAPARAVCIHEESPENNATPIFFPPAPPAPPRELSGEQRRRFRLQSSEAEDAEGSGALRATTRQVLATLRARHVGDPSRRQDLKAEEIQIFSDNTPTPVEYLSLIQTPGIRTAPDTWLFKPSGRGAWIYSLPGAGVTESYYLIGFTPPPSPEGQCHKLRIVIGSDTVGYSPTEYCYARGVDPLQETKLGREMAALASGSDAGAISLHGSVQVFHSAPERDLLHVSVEFPREEIIQRRASNGAYNVRVHLLGLLEDANGRVARRFSDNFLHQYSTEGYHNPDQAPVAFATELTAPPGDYTLKLVVSDEKNFGVATVPVHAPSYDGRVLGVSQIALSKYIRALEDMQTDMPQLPKLNPTPLVSQGLQVIPCAVANYRHNETLYLYFEIYEPLLANAGAGAVTVGFRMSVKSDDSGKVLMATDVEDLRENIVAGEMLIPVGKQIEVDRLPYGNYHLEIEAYDSVGQRATVSSRAFHVGQP